MAVGGDPDAIRDKARELRGWALSVQDTRASALRRPAATLVLVGILVTLSACDSGRVDGVPEGAVSDVELFEQIGQLDQVVEQDLWYRVNFSDGDAYVGGITVENDADVACVLDEVHAILWMGRDTDIRVDVRLRDGDETLRKDDVGTAGWWTGPEDRYGPRPEPGTNPTPAPAPACG